MRQEEMKPFVTYKINRKKVDGRVLGFVMVMRDTQNNLYQVESIVQNELNFKPRKSFEKAYNMVEANTEDYIKFVQAQRKSRKITPKVVA